MILSLLSSDGLDAVAYRERFGAPPTEHFAELAQLVDRGLATQPTESAWLLTARGLGLADALGPWLFSDDVRRKMAEFELQ